MSATMPRPSPRSRPRALGSLRHRNYRLFFAGQAISTVGTWMQSVAQPWLVLHQTHSGFLVGLAMGMQYLPVMALGPVGGLVADRFPKRRVLQATQTLFVLPAIFLFAVTWTGTAQYWMVLVAALLWGLVQVVDAPTRQAFAIEMVGRDDLMNAIALNSSVWNGAAVVGPAVAGILIATVGVPLCFLANAVSYLAAITALSLMRNMPVVVRGHRRTGAWDAIVEGARYIWRDPLVGSMLVVVAVFSLFAMNRLTLLPLFDEQILHAGATGFGALLACNGFGALLGAAFLAATSSRVGGRRYFQIALAWAVTLVVFSASRWFLLSAVLLTLAGTFQMLFLAAANTRIQLATPDRLRGRVMAFYSQAVMGMGPIGAAQSGAMASLFGPPVAMAFGAILSGLVAIGVRVVNPAAFTLEPDERIG